MTVEIRLDLKPGTVSGDREIRAIANGLLAMVAGGAMIEQESQFTKEELDNDPANTAPRIVDLKPIEVVTSESVQVDPSKLGFGGTVPPAPVTGGPVVPPPPQATTTVPPVPAPAAETPSAGSVLMDARGIPWDSRIHATNKSKKQNGDWKVKKGVPTEEIERIENEYKQNGQQSQQTTNSLTDYISLMGKLGNIIISDANPNGRLTVEQVAEILQRDVGVPNTLALMQRPDLVPYAVVAISNVLGSPL